MSLGVVEKMGIDDPEDELEDAAEPNEGFLGKPTPPAENAASDPFDDFDDDDFDDNFDDDFEEEWDDDLPGDADQFEPDEKEEEEDASFSDDPEFDDE